MMNSAAEVVTSDGKKIKVKGRGALRFRGGFEEEREKTPPHWKREQVGKRGEQSSDSILSQYSLV